MTMPTILSILMLAATACAQLPPAPVPVTNYLAAAAVDAGANYSAWSDEIGVLVGQHYSLYFNPSPTPGVTYVIAQGSTSGHYTFLSSIGTNTSVPWPLPVNRPPTVLCVACGGVPFLIITNPTCRRFFKALPTTTSNLWSIADTSDMAAGWTNPLTFVTAPNGHLTTSPNAIAQ